jgi:hypothetical protein
MDAHLDALLPQAAQERVDDNVVSAVALFAHARLEVIGGTIAPPGITAELDALFGVNNGPMGPALLHG